VPHRAELTAADLAALRRGEVPTFGIRPGLRDVWLEDGRRLPGVLAEPPLHAIRRRLAGLRPADQAEQIAIIDASLAAAGQEQAPAGPAAAGQATPGGAASAGDGLAAAGRPPARSWRRAGPPPRDQLRDRLLGAALRIGEHLGATAVRDGGRIGWLTVETVDAQHRRVAPAGLAGYSGLPGIGLFVSSLAAVTGDRQAAVLADQVADEVARRCLAAAKLGPPARGTGVGAFGPLLAPVYYLAHAAVLHGRAELADLAHAKLVPAVAGLLAAGRPEVSPASVAGGRAGCVLALLALHAVRPDPELVRLAGLAARGPAGPGGQPAAPGSGEAGLGYGASGAALALSRLHAVTGEPELADAAGALLGGEPDPAPAAGWCDGAAGAGMARLELAADPALAHLRDTLTSGLRRSVAVVAANLDRAPDDSLCHGRLGMLELLTSPDLASSGLASADPASADPASADPASADPASTGPAGLDPWLVAAELCERGAAGCRTALPQPAPGLLPGLAGIGFGLIRLACPGVVPHALVLAPPAPRADATDRVPDPLAAAT
jgi:hypothetical protein